MKQLAVPSALPPALVALDRALGPGGASALDPTVPIAVWRRALSGPATEFLSRPGKELRASIVRSGWALGGGATDAMPPALPLILELIHAGSLIIDDVEDGSDVRRGAAALHHLVGVPVAINTGSWMYFWALAELAELGIPAETELAGYRAAVTTLVRCHQGQALDLSTRVIELELADVPGVVAATTRLKTGTLCGFAAELGAICAGASVETRAAIARFGNATGIALQMLDDLGSLTSAERRDKGREDLRGGRPTWPWAWLAELYPFAWARFTAKAREVTDCVGDVDRLADELAELTAATGRARIRAALEGALGDLRAVIGPNQAIDAIAADLQRMEASYG